MFANTVNRDDLAALARRLSSGGGAVVGRLGGAHKRVQASWDAFESSEHVPPYEMPLFAAHQRSKLGCEGEEGFPEMVARRFLTGTDLVGLSIGCGTGSKERRWVATDRFSMLDAFDVSPELIDRARERAASLGVADRLHFEAADAREYAPRDGGYDVIIADSSLHHIGAVDEFIATLAGWLRPDGRLVVYEFVGPRRFQWREDQVAEAQRLIEQIPLELRVASDGRIKTHVRRPGRLLMRFVDPSEAIESDRILPGLETHFDCIWRVDQGGSVVNLVFDGIAHHFLDLTNERAQAYVQHSIDREDELVAAGRMASNNTAGIYRAS